MALYTAGMTITAAGGALVVVETCPRKVGKQRGAYGFLDDVYEDVLRIVGAERLDGTIPEMVARAATRLTVSPMLDDSVSRIEVGSLGPAVLRLFRDRHMHPWPVVIGGEQETWDKVGNVTVPLLELQGVATLLLQLRRVEVVDSLNEAGTVLRSLESLESLPPSGPARDLGIAAAIALWTAQKSPSRDGWASNKPRPTDPEIEWTHEQRRKAVERAKAINEGRSLQSILRERDRR